MNDGTGNYELTDSVYFEFGYAPILGAKIDDNDYNDIIGRHQNSNPHKENIAIIYNFGLSQFDSIKIFNLYNNYVVIDNYAVGDIDNDGDIDIVFTCNNDFFWGIIYNDGTGNFSSPIYYDLTFPPVDIACADLNEDGRADVVVCGSDTDIYFSTETGFQQLVLTTSLSHDVLISDFDNDGDNDVITHTTFVYPNHRVYMFENLGINQFCEHDYFQFTPFCSYTQIADLNNDSLPDMVFNDFNYSGLYIYYNKGNFQLEFNQFIAINYSASRGLSLNDFDNNGFNDIATFTANTNPEYYLKLLFNDGNGTFLENLITNIKTSNFELQTSNITCYPNPFKTELNINYNIKESSYVGISVFNLTGELIKVLTHQQQEGGNYLIKWDGLDQGANQCKPGPYLLTFRVNSKALQTIKLLKI